jgi:hypothetical protein
VIIRLFLLQVFYHYYNTCTCNDTTVYNIFRAITYGLMLLRPSVEMGATDCLLFGALISATDPGMYKIKIISVGLLSARHQIK